MDHFTISPVEPVGFAPPLHLYYNVFALKRMERHAQKPSFVGPIPDLGSFCGNRIEPDFLAAAEEYTKMPISAKSRMDWQGASLLQSGSYVSLGADVRIEDAIAHVPSAFVRHAPVLQQIINREYALSEELFAIKSLYIQEVTYLDFRMKTPENCPLHIDGPSNTDDMSEANCITNVYMASERYSTSFPKDPKNLKGAMRTDDDEHHYFRDEHHLYGHDYDETEINRPPEATIYQFNSNIWHYITALREHGPMPQPRTILRVASLIDTKDKSKFTPHHRAILETNTLAQMRQFSLAPHSLNAVENRRPTLRAALGFM